MTEPDAPGGLDESDCAVCGTAIDTEEWHPVASRSAPEGTRIVPFCSEACREQWLAQHQELTAGEQ
jgi:predicted nucleic acid-binding Zn ribbon protein